MAETVGVIGAGALGSLLAVKLARAGHAVHVLARSESSRAALAADAPHGLSIERDPESLRPASLLFICVKAHDTLEAAGALRPLGPKFPGIASLQNGWDHMAILERELLEAPLLAGATTLGAFFDEAGALHASTEGATTVAPWGATEARWADYAVTVLTSAGFEAEARGNAPAVLWRKLALNAAVNPVGALANRTNGEIRDEPHLLRLALAACREAAEVGIHNRHLPAESDPCAMLEPLLHATRGNRSSMAEDLARGRPTEVDAILGAVLREATRASMEVPTIAALDTLIRAAEKPRSQGPA